MNITLRSIYKDGPEGVKALYEFLRIRSEEDDPHTNISHRKLPPYCDHVRFVRSHPYRAWYFVKVDGLVAGSINATRHNEVGIIISPDYRGKGIANAALRKFLAQHKPLPALASIRPGYFVANINPENYRSIALFKGLGFTILQHTYKL